MPSDTYIALQAALAEAVTLAARLEAERAALEVPPVVVDPPPTVPAEPDPTPFEAPPEAWGRYSAPGALKVDRPLMPWPRYSVPQRHQLDLVLSSAGCRPVSSTGAWLSPREAYQQLVGTGALDSGRQARIGVIGDGGRFIIGGAYSAFDPTSVVPPPGRESMPVSVALVGMTEDARAEVAWAHNSAVAMTGDVSIFHMGIRGAKDSFALRIVQPHGRVVLDDVWILPHAEIADNQYASMIHANNYTSWLLRRLRWRGVNPGDPGLLVREHCLYDKSQRADAVEPYVVVAECELLGGNRTGTQKRPDAASLYPNARPAGDVYYVNNRSTGWGWTHDWEEGGAVMTCWSAPEGRVFMLGNRVKDARYACLGVEGQAANLNWLNDAGYPVREVHVAGNTVANPRSQRAAMTFGAVERLFLYGDNVLEQGAKIMLNSAFNQSTSGIPNGTTSLVGRMSGERIVTWRNGGEDALSEAELSAMVVAP